MRSGDTLPTNPIIQPLSQYLRRAPSSHMLTPPQLHLLSVTLQRSAPLLLAHPTTNPMPERPLVPMQHPPNLSRAQYPTNMAPRDLQPLLNSHFNPLEANHVTISALAKPISPQTPPQPDPRLSPRPPYLSSVHT
jgi:hypothetical protein